MRTNNISGSDGSVVSDSLNHTQISVEYNYKFIVFIYMHINRNLIHDDHLKHSLNYHTMTSHCMQCVYLITIITLSIYEVCYHSSHMHLHKIVIIHLNTDMLP